MTRSRLFPRRVVAASTVCALAGLGLAFDAPAQTGQEAPTTKDLPEAGQIIDWSIEAIGGKEKLQQIKSARTKATTMVASPANPETENELTIEIYWMKPDKVFIKQSMEEFGEFSQGRNGEVAWAINPMTRRYQLLGARERELMMAQSMLSVNMLGLKDRFKTLETTGIENFNGTESYKVHGIDKDDLEHDLYFATDSRLLVAQDSDQNTQFGPIELVVSFDDWKEIDGVKTYTSMDVNQAGQQLDFKITEIEFNKVDEAVFAVPEEVRKLADDAKKKDDTSGDDAKKGDDDDDDGGGG